MAATSAIIAFLAACVGLVCGRSLWLGEPMAIPLHRRQNALYVSAIPLAFVNQWIADALYVAVALMWLVPDARIEAKLKA